jgi:hypothetical protein
MEERLPGTVSNRYDALPSPADLGSLDDWRNQHVVFLEDEVQLTSRKEHPWTFRADNAANLKRPDPITVLRIESLEGAIKLASSPLSVSEIDQRIRHLRSGSDAQRRSASKVVERFPTDWNARRDRRPLFATSFAGVEHLLPSDPLADTGWDWVSDLRDHLGLGGHVPKASGEVFPVLVMVYPLDHVAAHCSPAWDGRVAVPTVLDGDLFPIFLSESAGAGPDGRG